jgi:mRNA-degrading endonuclease RelE of RelBE toxin-antitoxin system
MVIFPAEFSTKASKYISKLDKVMKIRIKTKINRLEVDPFPREVERVEDYKGKKVFRARVGDQRILYIVNYNPNKLIVTKIDKRGRVYNK